MESKTIANEIRYDHALLLQALKRVLELPLSAKKNRWLANCLTALGANHLAEERTVYKLLEAAHPQASGEAQAFHLLLDDLSYSIQIQGGDSDAQEHHINLLRSLLKVHFEREEQMITQLTESQIPFQEQLSLGRQYRQKFKNGIQAMGFESTSLRQLTRLVRS